MALFPELTPKNKEEEQKPKAKPFAEQMGAPKAGEVEAPVQAPETIEPEVLAPEVPAAAAAAEPAPIAENVATSAITPPPLRPKAGPTPEKIEDLTKPVNQLTPKAARTAEAPKAPSRIEAALREQAQVQEQGQPEDESSVLAEAGKSIGRVPFQMAAFVPWAVGQITRLTPLGATQLDETLLEWGKGIEQYGEELLPRSERAARPAVEWGEDKDFQFNADVFTDPEWLAGNIPEVLGQLVGSMGIAKYGVKGAMKLFPALSAKAQKILGTTIGGVTGGGMEGVADYAQKREEGYSIDDAANASGMYAIASGLLNGISLDRYLDKFQKAGLAKYLLNTIIEGGTEALESPASAIVDKLVLGEEIDWKDVFAQGASEGILGAIGGGVGTVFTGRGGEQDASQDRKTTPLYGDVRDQQEAPETLPGQVGGERVYAPGAEGQGPGVEEVAGISGRRVENLVDENGNIIPAFGGENALESRQKPLNIMDPDVLDRLAQIEGDDWKTQVQQGQFQESSPLSMQEQIRKTQEEAPGYGMEDYVGNLRSNVIYGKDGYSRYTVQSDGTIVPDMGSFGTEERAAKARQVFGMDETLESRLGLYSAAERVAQGVKQDSAPGEQWLKANPKFEGELSEDERKELNTLNQRFAEGKKTAKKGEAPLNAEDAARRSALQTKASQTKYEGLLAKGTKDEELEWIGLPEFLEGRKNVSKQEVLDYIKQGGVQVEEKVLSDEPQDPTKELELEDQRTKIRSEMAGLRDRAAEIQLSYWDLDFVRDSLTRGEITKEDLDPALPEILSEYETLNNKLRDIQEALHSEYLKRERPKYGDQSNLQMEGEKKNYKEILLKLGEPENAAEVRKLRQQIETEKEAVRQAFAYEERTGEDMTEQRLEAENNLTQAEQRLAEIQNAEYEAYTGGHYGGTAPNVFAHVRVNERVDANGKRTLFIEEIQSDWHQRGRKEGYVSDIPAVDRKRLEELRRRIEEINVLVNDLGLSSEERKQAITAATTELSVEQRTYRTINNEKGKLYDELAGLESQYGKGAKVPDAPFKKSWPMVAMKRMIRYAAENGFDQVAWTPGEVQAERYKLSKYVDAVRVDRNTATQPPSLDITLDLKDGTTDELYGVSDEKLEEYVGKELAQKIITDRDARKTKYKNLLNELKTLKDDDPKGDQIVEELKKLKSHKQEYTGLDLEIGGEGMKSFYDKELKNEANKLLKKYGSRVGTTTIRTAEPTQQWMSGEEAVRLHGDTMQTWYALADNEEARNRYLNEARRIKFEENEEVWTTDTEGTQEVWAFPMTPKLVEAALNEGFAQFSEHKGKAPTAAPVRSVREANQILEEKFGKRGFARLKASGLLRVVSPQEFRLLTGRDPAQTMGIFDEGRILLHSNSAEPFAVLLHEGTHSNIKGDSNTGLKLLLGEAYPALQRQFDRLVSAGNGAAKDANARAEEVVLEMQRRPGESAQEYSDRQDAVYQQERLAYYVEYVAAQKVKTPLYKRIMAAIKAWVMGTDFGRQLQRILGPRFEAQLDDATIVALARRALNQSALKRLEGPGTQTPVKPVTEPTLASKASDANARKLHNELKNTKIVDENGEPLVVYRGRKVPVEAERPYSVAWVTPSPRYAGFYATNEGKPIQSYNPETDTVAANASEQDVTAIDAQINEVTKANEVLWTRYDELEKGLHPLLQGASRTENLNEVIDAYERMGATFGTENDRRIATKLNAITAETRKNTAKFKELHQKRMSMVTQGGYVEPYFVNVVNPYVTENENEVFTENEQWFQQLRDQGYDGIIYSPGFGTDNIPKLLSESANRQMGAEIVLLYPEKQIKSAISPEMMGESAESQKYFPVDTKSPGFLGWFRDSKIVDAEGNPLRVFHGTTHDITSFKIERGNIENDFGLGFYFSNSPDDVAANYAGEGPDLTQRIELRAERIDVEEDVGMDAARVRARSELSGGAPNTIPVYLSFQNPVIVGGRDSTYFEYALEYDTEAFIDEATEEVRADNTEDGELLISEGELAQLSEERARELSDENYYTTEGGSLSSLVEALRQASYEFDDVNIDQAITDLMEAAQYDSIRAQDVVDTLKKSEGIAFATNDTGDMAVSEIIRKAFELAGYDGIIDNTVSSKFGYESGRAKAMEGVYPDTVHYIAFNPEQVKSSISNTGRYEGAELMESRRRRGQQEYVSDYEEQNRAIRRDNETMWYGAKKWFSHQMRPGGLLNWKAPKAFELQVMRDAAQNTWDEDAIRFSRELDKAVKRAYGKSIDNMSKEEQKLIDNALNTAKIVTDRNGNPVLKPDGTPQTYFDLLPNAEMKKVVLGMRQYIDQFSKEYIQMLEEEIDHLEMAGQTEGDEKALRAKINLLQTLHDNIGKYAHRSFQVFNDKNYSGNVPSKVLDEARQHFLNDPNARKKGINERNVDAFIQEMLENATAFNSFEEWITESPLGQTDFSLLRKRDNTIPEPILNLLGVYTDPRYNFINSAAKITRLTFNQKFLKNLVEVGEGTFLWKNKTDPSRPGTASHQIKGGTSYSPLAGYWTYPEVAQGLLEAAGDKSRGPEWLNNMMRLVAGVKYIKTIGTPAPTGLRNWFSAGLATIANANLNWNGLVTATAALGDYFGNNTEGAKRAYLHHLGVLGVSLDTPFAGELKLLGSFIGASNVLQSLGEPGNLLHTSRTKALKFKNAMENFYRFGDDFWKIAAFEQLKKDLLNYKGETVHAMYEGLSWDDGTIFNDQLGKIELKQKYGTNEWVFADAFGNNITERQTSFPTRAAAIAASADVLTTYHLEKMAAERIRNTYMTYSLVGRGFKGLAKFPFTGTFVSFPAEVLRTTGNMFYYLVQDFKDPDLRPMAIKRALGMMTVAAAAHAAVAAMSRMLDVDDDELEDARKLLADWNQNSNLMPVGRSDDGKLRLVDLSYVDLYNYLRRPINAMLRDEPIDERAWQAIVEGFTPFFGVDITAQAVTEVLMNQKLRGGQVFDRNASATEQATQIKDHLKQTLYSGTYLQMEKVLKGWKGEVSRGGKQFNMADELKALAGVRVTEVDPKASMWFKAGEFKSKRSSATNTITRAVSDPADMTPDELRSWYDDARQARAKAYNDLIDVVNAARRLGMTDYQIRRVLGNLQVGKKDIPKIMRGQVPSWIPSKIFLKSALRKSDVLYTPEIAAEIMRRRRQVTRWMYQDNRMGID